MQYRREIDGLRALAVVPVILFHAGFEVFSGGYVGVDVFFVISGYLITSIIINEMAAGHFSILKFYERRARRILPALFFVILCCIPLAWFLMLPTFYEDFSKSIIAVALFASNFHFGGADGYFTPMSDLQPLLHTWSLGVEEQYYLIFPLILLGLWRYGTRKIMYVIGALAGLSLLSAEIGLQVNPKANFFFTPSRVWELLAGSLCAFIPLAPKGWKSNLLSLLGFCMIAFSILTFDASLPFPSLYTLLPVAGSVLIILFGTSGTWTARLLSLPVFVGVGLISYSAYLWHQPIFAFARLSSIEEPDQQLLAALAALTLVLAYLSWRFIEQPFRRGTIFKPGQYKAIFGSAGIVAAFLISVGVWVSNEAYFNDRLSEKGAYYYSFMKYHETPTYFKQYRTPKCFYGSSQNSFSYYDQELCLSKSSTRKNYVVLGDSHAAHLWYALNEHSPDINVMQASASGCLPVITYDGRKRCTDLVRFIYEDYIINNEVDGIILSGRWKPEHYAAIRPTVDYLTKHVDDVIVIGPNVEFGAELPMILGKYNDLPLEKLAALARSTVRPKEFLVTSEMQQRLAGSGALFVPLVSQVCRDTECNLFSNTGAPLMFDKGHFTLSGAMTIVEKMVSDGTLPLH